MLDNRQTYTDDGKIIDMSLMVIDIIMYICNERGTNMEKIIFLFIYLKSVKLDREGNAGYIVPAIDESLLRTCEPKHYLYPIPTQEIALYQSQEKGYELTQNPGW